MSNNKKGNLVRDWPLKKDGSIDLDKLPRDENGMTEVDRQAEEALKKGELKMVDILGNEEYYTSEHEILNEFITGEEKPLEVGRVLSVVKHLQGKILTIFDATYHSSDINDNRLKFIKDIVKEAFSSSSNWIYEMSIREFEEVDTKKKKS